MLLVASDQEEEQKRRGVRGEKRGRQIDGSEEENTDEGNKTQRQKLSHFRSLKALENRTQRKQRGERGRRFFAPLSSLSLSSAAHEGLLQGHGTEGVHGAGFSSSRRRQEGERQRQRQQQQPRHRRQRRRRHWQQSSSCSPRACRPHQRHRCLRPRSRARCPSDKEAEDAVADAGGRKRRHCGRAAGAKAKQANRSLNERIRGLFKEPGASPLPPFGAPSIELPSKTREEESLEWL